ncbi:hypothetical protein, partial [Holdemanella biformis]|uniref:hypothetical protein n=1 Tax=Holdemanella biformis TaxID=1735 RepID=UPI00307A21CE
LHKRHLEYLRFYNCRTTDATMAFACSAPTSSINDQSVSPNICSNMVMPEFIQKYFELYPAS